MNRSLLFAPAKVNLTLEVLGKRPDGYHALRSLVVPIALYDEIEIEPAERLHFTCDDPTLADDGNLVLRAARAIGVRNLRIALRKQIPVQAGLGGGSSDAAALLLAARAGRLGALPDWEDLATARSLGSDVPFFLAEGAALVEGSGERVTPAGAMPPWATLVVKPPVSISTAEAFRLLDERVRPQRPRNESLGLRALAALQRADFRELTELLSNDFHDDALARHPEIARAAAAIEAAGPSRALLSGSGSSLFAIYERLEDAAAAAERIALPPEYRRFVAPFRSDHAWRGVSV
uniref:4-(cytidine 5'-diphospho)-2-C-methyl-D-erythritol kinase n=1 Tax=mine drainage metagenome TaxID=410659 RepID=E6Q7R1_9ZZZZ